MGETIGEEGGGGGRHGSQGQQGRQGGDKDEFLLLSFLYINIFCTFFSLHKEFISFINIFLNIFSLHRECGGKTSREQRHKPASGDPSKVDRIELISISIKVDRIQNMKNNRVE